MSAEGSLYSPYWYRVASLHPRIQPGTRIQRQVLRGKEWFVFTHPVNGQHYRLNRKAYELVGRLDGEHSLDTLWNGLQSRLGDDLPTQDDVIAMLTHLMEAGLVLFDTLPDWALLKQHQKAKRNSEQRANLNPFAFRLRLLDPSVLLARLAPLQSVIWHPLTGLLWLALVAWGLLQAVFEWHAISTYASVHLLTPRFLLLAWIAYPLMKAVHELGHALTVRHWGGDVKEVGVGFFLLVPAPYVDASAATAFASKWQRTAVSSAGIVVELLLAAIALQIWLITQPGLVHDVAFVVAAIGGLSTLAFNGNPLLRFDGYYILCDVLELPNLGTRSQRWWVSLIKRSLKRGGQDAEAHAQRSDRVWLFAYAPASWAYRLLIAFVIVQWVAEKSLLLGMMAMVWLFFSLLVKPVWSVMCLLFAPAHPSTQPWKPLLGAGCATAVLIACILGVPISASTVATGVVWLPEQSQVRAASDGRVAAVLAQDGQQVVKGQALVMLEEPALLAKRARIAAQIAMAETEQAGGWTSASPKGRNAFEDLERLHQDLAQIDTDIQKLTLRAEADGTFVLPHADDMLGRDVLKGSLIAYVLAPEATMVRAAIPQDDIGFIKEGVQHISVHLAEAGNQYFPSRLVRAEPAATTRLPSIALGDKGGGSLITDPTDREGLTVQEPVFLVDVQLRDHHVLRAGGRAWVRFEHEARPLAETAVLRLRQLFLKMFAAEIR